MPSGAFGVITRISTSKTPANAIKYAFSPLPVASASRTPLLESTERPVTTKCMLGTLHHIRYPWNMAPPMNVLRPRPPGSRSGSVNMVGLLAFGSYSLSFIIMESRALLRRSLQSRRLIKTAPTTMARTPTPPPTAAATRAGMDTVVDLAAGAAGVVLASDASAVSVAAAGWLSAPGLLGRDTTIVPPVMLGTAPASVSRAPPDEARRSVVGAAVMILVSASVDSLDPLVGDEPEAEADDDDNEAELEMTLVTSVLPGGLEEVVLAAPAAAPARSLDWKLIWIMGAISV
jgi:hypothetical protein